MNGTTPAQRAKELKKILKTTYDDGRGATPVNITDILTDLRHLCDAEGLSFADLDRVACGHYGPERAQSTVEAV
mgnify:CR=1 FL=1